MVLKAFDFTRNSDGTHETYHEGGGADDIPGSPQYLIFSDAVSPTSLQGSQSAQLLAEQTLNEYLTSIHEGPIDEAVLVKAFQHSNRRLIQLFDEEDDQVAVSALILAPIKGESKEPKLVVAGVGDCRLYSIGSNGLELCFSDPKVSPQSETLNLEQRYQHLRNALGVNDTLEVNSQVLTQGQFQRYLFTSYGCYQALSEETLLALATRPHHDEQGVSQHLTSAADTPHLLRISCASYESPITLGPLQGEDASATSPYASPLIQRRRRERAAALALSVFVSGMVVFLAVETFFPKKQGPIAQAPLPLQDEKHLIAKANPFQDEDPDTNSWVTALKEQNDIQRKKIHAITEDLHAERQQNVELQKLLNTSTQEGSQPLVEELGNKLRAKNKTISELRVSQDELRNEIHSSHSEVQQLKRDCEALIARGDTHQEVVNGLEQDLQTLQKAKAELQSSKSELEQRIQWSQDSLEQTQEALSLKEQDALSLTASLNEQEQKVGELSHLLKKTQGLVSTLEKKQEENERQSSLAEKHLQESQNEISALNTRLEKQAETLRSQEQELKMQLTQWEEERETLAHTHAEALSSVQGQLQSSVHSIEELSKELALKIGQIQELKTLLQQNQEEINAGTEALGVAEKRITAEQTRYEELAQASEQKTQTIQELRRQKELMEAALEKAESTITALTEAKASLTEELQNESSAFARKERNLLQSQSELQNALQQSQSQLQSTFEELQELVETSTEKEAALQATVTTLRDEAEKQQVQWEKELGSAKSALQKQGQQWESEVITLQEQIKQRENEALKQMESYEHLRAELSQKLDQALGSKETMEGQLQEVHKAYTTEQQKAREFLAELQSTRSILEEKHTALETSQATAQAYAKRYEEMELQLSGQVTDLTQAYEKLLNESKSKQEALQTELSTLTEEKEGVESALAERSSELNAVTQSAKKQEEELRHELSISLEQSQEMETTLLALKENAGQLEDQLKHRSTQISKLTELYEEALSTINTQKEKLVQTEELLNTHQQQCDLYIQDLASREQTIQQLEESLTALKVERDGLLVSSQEEANRLESAIQKAEASIATLQSDKQHLWGLIEERDAQLHEFAESQEETLTRLSSQEDQLATLEQQLSQTQLTARQTIANLEREKHRLEESLEERNSQLGDLGERHQETLSQLDERESELERYKSALEQAEQSADKAIANLDKEKQNLEAFLKEKHQQLELLSENHEGVLSRLKQKEDELHYSQNSLQQAELATEEAIAKLEGDKERLLKLIGERDTQLSTLTDRHDELMTQLSEKESTLRKQGAEFEQNKQHQELAFQSLKKDKEELYARLQERHSQLQDFTEKNDQALAEIAQLESQLSTYKIEIQQSEQRAKQSMATMENDRRRLLDLLEQRDCRLEDFTEDHETALATIVSLEAQVSQYKGQVERAEERTASTVATLEREKQKLQGFLEEKDRRIEKLTLEEEDLLAELREKDGEIAHYKAALGSTERSTEEALVALEKDKLRLLELLKERNTQLNELTDEHEEALAQVSARETELADYKGRLKKAEQSTRSSIAQLEEEKQRLEQQLKKSLSQLNHTSLETHEILAQLEDRGEELTHYKQLLEESEAKHKQALATFEKVQAHLKDQLSQKDEKLSKLEHLSKAHGEDKKYLSELQVEYEKKSEAHALALSQLEETRHLLAKERADHRSGIQEFEQSLGKLQARESELKQQLAIQAGNEEAKQELVSVQSQLNEARLVLNTERESYRDTIRKLQERLAEQDRQVNRLEQAQLSTEIGHEEARKALQEALSTIQELQSKLSQEKITRQEVARQLEQRLSEQAMERQETERKLAKLEELLSGEKEFRRRYESAQNELRELSRDRESLFHQNALLENELQHTLVEMQHKESLIADLSRDTDQFKGEVRALQSSYQERFQNLVSARISAEKQLKDLEDQLVNSQQDSKQRGSALAAAQQAFQASNEHIGQLKARNEALAQENQDLAEKLTALSEFQEMYKRERNQRLSLERKMKSVGQDSTSQREEPKGRRASTELDAARKEYAHFRRSVADNSYETPRPRAGVSGATRVHLVSEGETLTSLSSRYYGSSKHWRSIYEANRDVIRDQDKITVGTALIIPGL